MENTDLTRAEWRTSSYSSGNGQCVEIAVLTEVVAMRDSKRPSGPILRFTNEEFSTFVTAARHGQFDRT
ncbi:DUF397 domain-containing protein [Streptomyces sp. NPDC049906]|uniref:DUF397 domain-containing protein n=1 Tax=Streptomyces sp. NPDC049906 TaxID=3155656 RepID=UPI0034209F08